MIPTDPVLKVDRHMLVDGMTVNYQGPDHLMAGFIKASRRGDPLALFVITSPSGKRWETMVSDLYGDFYYRARHNPRRPDLVLP